MEAEEGMGTFALTESTAEGVASLLGGGKKAARHVLKAESDEERSEWLYAVREARAGATGDA